MGLPIPLALTLNVPWATAALQPWSLASSSSNSGSRAACRRAQPGQVCGCASGRRGAHLRQPKVERGDCRRPEGRERPAAGPERRHLAPAASGFHRPFQGARNPKEMKGIADDRSYTHMMARRRKRLQQPRGGQADGPVVELAQVPPQAPRSRVVRGRRGPHQH